MMRKTVVGISGKSTSQAVGEGYLEASGPSDVKEGSSPWSGEVALGRSRDPYSTETGRPVWAQ